MPHLRAGATRMSATILSRVQALEAAVANLQKAMQNVASVQQLRQLLALQQQQVSELTTRVEELESQLSILQTS